MRAVQYWHGLGVCPNPAGVTMIKPRAMLPGHLIVGYRDEPDHNVAAFTHATIDRDVALAFSVLSGGATVCEVDHGELTPEADPDFQSLSVRFRGPVRVLSSETFAQAKLPHARRVVELLAPDALSEGGQRWHYPDGRIRPPSLWRAWGYTEDDFDWLAPWFPWQYVWENEKAKLLYAVSETGQQFTVWPKSRPLPSGTRCKPQSTLADEWTTPGFVPGFYDLKMQSGMAREALHPWEW